MLEPLRRLNVLEQERQVENWELLGVLAELRKGRRGQLHVAEQHGLKHGVIVKELRIGEDLHLDLAGQSLLNECLELVGGLPLGGVLGNHVAELDDDLVGLNGWCGDQHGDGCESDTNLKMSHLVSP